MSQAKHLLVELLGPGQRLSPVWVLTGTMVAYVVYRRLPAEERRGFLRFLVPGDSYRSPSSWVDVRMWLVNFVLFLGGLQLLILGSNVLATAIAPHGSSGHPTVIGTVVFAVLTFLALDLGDYLHHRAAHELPVLWEFHKVHHSAEVLTPLAAQREHPVDIIGRAFAHSVCVGVVQGVLLHLIPGTTLLSVHGVAMLALPYLAINNLRHSHVWISWGPRWSHVFSSPAQHQCHHGSEPRHIDINYGVVLSLWDWLFGTLYVPRGREIVRYGLVGGVQPHPTLRAAYLAPFAAAARRLRSVDRLADPLGVAGVVGGPVELAVGDLPQDVAD